MAASGPEIGEGNKVHRKKPSTQKAVVLVNESEDIVMTDRAPTDRQSQGQIPEDTDEVQLTEVRITRSASKWQGRAVETEKKPEANSVAEKFENAKVYLQSCQSAFEDTQEKLAVCEQDLKDKQAQLCRKKKDLATCRRQLKEYKAVIRDMKKANKDLEETLEASHEELSKCKDDLFSLQGVAQTPDSTISKRFETISQQIIHWIEMAVATFEKTNPDAEPDAMFSAGEYGITKEFMRLHPGAGEYLVRYFIHCFLARFVFGATVNFFGLPEETAQLLQEAELKFAELDPPRDSVAIASWRSETLNALVRTRKVADYCQHQSQDLNSKLFKNLSTAFPALFSGSQARATFYKQVLLPSVKLANAIKMSTSEYVVSTPHPFLTEAKPIATDLLQICKMVDFKTGKHLKPDSAVVADKDGVIGKFVIGLEPALRRVTKGKVTTLHQATILVELLYPLGKRVKASV